MSTRVCYMIRDERGGRLRSLRVVGQGVDVSYPEAGRAASGDTVDVFSAAAWLRAQLEQARSTRSLTRLVLDDSGSVCSWVTTASFDAGSVATAARGDGAASFADEPDERKPNARPELNPVTYFAADPLEGLIQPLVTSRESSQAAAAGEPQRVAVLAAADTPARLLIDALDSLGIVVESVSSLWQASATAWNSAATLQTSSILPDAAQIDAEQPTAATIVADGARLAWGWSQAGRLVCGGSIRVSPSQPPTAESNELAPLGGGPIDATSSALPPAPPLGPFADEADVPRLVAEWLAWSLQTGAAPNRITCLLNGSDRDTDSSLAAARFGRALGTSWAGATVDIVTSADAVGATLRRLCEVLDSTPAARSAADNAALPTGLASLELRPGRSHRAMYIWSSVALTALAGALGILSWRTAAATVAAKNASEEWRRGWESVAEQSFPDALSPKPGVSASMQMWDEVRRLEDARRPADRAEPALPVMQELDSLSYVLSDPAYSLDSVEIDSKGTIRVIAVANDIAAAELLFEAIKLVAGTNSVDWTATYRARTDKGESKVTATFNAKWDPALLTPPTRTPL